VKDEGRILHILLRDPSGNQLRVLSETAVRVYIRKSHSYSWDILLPRPLPQERGGKVSAPQGKGGGEVKDEKPVLYTLILYHSAVYTFCEGVKDFLLKVYGVSDF
jgi:hypothetical protein